MPALCERRRRHVGLQQFVVLKYLVESGPPWGNILMAKVSMGSVGRDALEVQG